MKISRYPVTVQIDQAGFHLVTFPDVPEAGTDAKTCEEALLARSAKQRSTLCFRAKIASRSLS
ncbi:MAG: type II toxin-antitoxin system HicB family antitoxin [Candidatus Binatia bacterium]